VNVEKSGGKERRFVVSVFVWASVSKGEQGAEEDIWTEEG
jgi:hypothetical protein